MRFTTYNMISRKYNFDQGRIKGTEKASPIHSLFHRQFVSSYLQDHRSQGGLDNSQSQRANVFRVDDPRSEPRVVHELTHNKMAEDAESDIAIRFVYENDYREISAKTVSAKRKLKRIALPDLFLSIVTTFIRAKLRVKF